MPTLVIDLLGKRKRIKVERSASIGRTSNNDVAIDHPAISRTHAFIDSEDGTFFVEDVGSANGTMMDGRPIKGRKQLNDGARIVMGPATIIFHADDAVVETAQPEDAAEGRSGILLNCSCGARLWVPDDRVGSTGQCRQCGATVTLGEKQVCSICQWEITADSPKQRCPACGLTFHADCWKENLGCSAYGCSQVNVLADPRDAQVHSDEVGAPPELAHGNEERGSWEKPLLAASVAASLLGILAFGVLALVVAVIASLHLSRHREKVSMRPLVACIAISTIGLIAGIMISGYWWLGWTMMR